MRNNYKEKKSTWCMRKQVFFNEKGQVAIFVIIALVIVSVIIVFLLYPRLGLSTTTATSPEGFLRGCLEPEIMPVVETLSKQGGYMNPEGFVLYNDVKVKYLCYTSQNYETCVVQQPNIKGQFEKELYSQIDSKIRQCYQSLIEDYESKGYSVSLGNINTKAEIVPGSIKISIINPITVSKETSQTFGGFEVNIQSRMYELLMTSTSIIDFESTYGDSETTEYMRYYPNLRIDKQKFDDGTTVYRLTDVVSKDSFTFASRSLVWPPGYGLE